MLITQEYLLDRYNYNPMSGILTFKHTCSGWRSGQIAGSVNSEGYLELRINKRLYKVHRIIWFMVYGQYPIANIDHINSIRIDNKLSNLREATAFENNCNHKLSKLNKLGVKGLTYKEGTYIRSPIYAAKIRCLGIRYTKSISVTEERSEEDIIEELVKWLKDTRNILHKDFANHGSTGI